MVWGSGFSNPSCIFAHHLIVPDCVAAWGIPAHLRASNSEGCWPFPHVWFPCKGRRPASGQSKVNYIRYAKPFTISCRGHGQACLEITIPVLYGADHICTVLYFTLRFTVNSLPSCSLGKFPRESLSPYLNYTVLRTGQNLCGITSSRESVIQQHFGPARHTLVSAFRV